MTGSPSQGHFTAILNSTFEDDRMNLLPGGYTFSHIVFWTVVALVMVGTNLVPIVLSIGAVILMLESMGKG